MNLADYNAAERGRAAKLARALEVSPVLISQWASGERPIPEDRAPALEAATEHQVPVEAMCPGTRWHRVADSGWPNGKPLIDKTPVDVQSLVGSANSPLAAAGASTERAAASSTISLVDRRDAERRQAMEEPSSRHWKRTGGERRRREW